MLVNIFFVALKAIGIIIMSVTLEGALSSSFADFLLIYSMVSLAAFVTEAGVYYSASQKTTTFAQLRGKIFRTTLFSFFAGVFTSAIAPFILNHPSKFTISFLILLPIFVNLNCLIRGMLVRINQSKVAGALDSTAYAFPGFFLFLQHSNIDLDNAFLIILASHLTVLIIGYLCVCMFYEQPFYPHFDFRYGKFEKQMFVSNVVAAPSSHWDLWLILKVFPDIDTNILLVRDIASKLPNLLFPILQVVIYPHMVAIDRISALKFYNKVFSAMFVFACIAILILINQPGLVGTILFDQRLSIYNYIFVYFIVKSSGSLIAPLMMYMARSDFSLYRNLLHLITFTIAFILVISSFSSIGELDLYKIMISFISFAMVFDSFIIWRLSKDIKSYTYLLVLVFIILVLALLQF